MLSAKVYSCLRTSAGAGNRNSVLGRVVARRGDAAFIGCMKTMSVIRGLLILRLFFSCAVIIAGAMIAIAYGFAGLAAWGASQDQCPYGNDCADAVAVMKLGLIIAPISCLISVVALWFLVRSLPR